MGYRNTLSSLWLGFPCGNRVHALKHSCRVIAVTTLIADADGHLLENHKSGLMLECLALDALRPDCAFAVFAAIAKLFLH